MELPTTAAAIADELQLPEINRNDARLKMAADAANDYVLRYHPEPTAADGEKWRADHRLGAALLGAGLYRAANRSGISDNGLGMSNDQAYARATDVRIEQLLQIERFAIPRIG